MGRILGGIDESELRDIVKAVIQDQMSQQNEEIQRLAQGMESLELQLQQDREEMARRLDEDAQIQDERLQKATSEQKAELTEALDQLDMIDSKVEKRLQVFEHKIESAMDLKNAVEDLEVKVYNLGQRLEKVYAHGEFSGRIEDLERVLRQKAGANHVESELVALRKGVQSKVDAQELEEKLAAAKQRIWQKAESAIGTLQQQLQKKADILSSNDRMDRIEQQVALIPGNPCETPNELAKRLEAIDRILQQKADNEAIDASLDELDQRMERKADCSLVDERLRNLERQVQQTAEMVDVSDRIADIEENVAQKADLADFARLQLALDRMGQIAEVQPNGKMPPPERKSPARPQSASARFRSASGHSHGESDGSMPPLMRGPSRQTSAGSVKANGRKILGNRGHIVEVQPSPRKPDAAPWRPNLNHREDQMGRSPLRGFQPPRSRSPGRSRGGGPAPGAQDGSPWSTPRGGSRLAHGPQAVNGNSLAANLRANSRAASADAIDRMPPMRLFGDGPRSPSPGRTGAKMRSQSPGPRMWRPRRPPMD